MLACLLVVVVVESSEFSTEKLLCDSLVDVQIHRSVNEWVDAHYISLKKTQFIIVMIFMTLKGTVRSRCLDSNISGLDECCILQEVL